METAQLVADLNKAFEFTPVKGHANEFVIRSKTPRPASNAETEMTPADWDKFEQDIADAFEQIP
ncbi:MAG: hypothetical protein KIS67_25360 [Verrucomicrobiae bacterium]|nr:hypothetical protein [Verrucomicrobiae bacterium]